MAKPFPPPPLSGRATKKIPLFFCGFPNASSIADPFQVGFENFCLIHGSVVLKSMDPDRFLNHLDSNCCFFYSNFGSKFRTGVSRGSDLAPVFFPYVSTVPYFSLYFFSSNVKGVAMPAPSPSAYASWDPDPTILIYKKISYTYFRLDYINWDEAIRAWGEKEIRLFSPYNVSPFRYV